MTEPQPFVVTVTLRAYEEIPEVLEERIQLCLGTHPTLSLRVDKVTAKMVSAPGAGRQETAGEQSHYIEVHDIGRHVWSVFSGRDSEDPDLVAVFVVKEQAEDVVRAKHPDPAEDGREVVFDGCVVAALVTEFGLVVGNDFHLEDDHEKLEAAFRKERGAPGDLFEAVENARQQLRPIPMVLHCPRCRRQHVDSPEEATGWTNPPHRSHLCARCGFVWRPADVPTTGVVMIETQGSRDVSLEPAARLLGAEVDALPERVRLYVYELETHSDPSGNVQTVASLTEQRDALLARVRELEAERGGP